MFDKYTDKQLMAMLWQPMIDDVTFAMVSNELKRRGYVYNNGWTKTNAQKEVVA